MAIDISDAAVKAGIKVRLEPEDYRALCRIARSDGLTPGVYSRRLVRRFLAHREARPVVSAGDRPSV